jgi:hypothetical protein
MSDLRAISDLVAVLDWAAGFGFAGVPESSAGPSVLGLSAVRP